MFEITYLAWKRFKLSQGSWFTLTHRLSYQNGVDATGLREHKPG